MRLEADSHSRGEADADEVRAVEGAGLLHHAGAMVLDGFDGDVKIEGDQLVGPPFHDRSKHRQLAGRERCEPFAEPVAQGVSFLRFGGGVNGALHHRK